MKRESFFTTMLVNEHNSSIKMTCYFKNIFHQKVAPFVCFILKENRWFGINPNKQNGRLSNFNWLRSIAKNEHCLNRFFLLFGLYNITTVYATSIFKCQIYFIMLICSSSSPISLWKGNFMWVQAYNMSRRYEAYTIMWSHTASYINIVYIVHVSFELFQIYC